MQKWLECSCNVMVHEIGHMFGLRHCIYYDCTMNGTMSSDESMRRRDATLCPICLKKLKSNIKFDCAERFKNLIEVSKKLGFTRQVLTYESFLNEAG